MMRKFTGILFVVFICFANGAVYAADTLEKAIEQEADYIIERSPRGTVLAIVNIKSDSSVLSEYIMEKLPDYVINNRKNITFVDRSKLDLIQQEISFQYSGEVSDETMISIGKKIGAQVIVTGTIIEAGNIYNFSIKLLDIESTKILGSNSTQIVHDDTMESFMGNSRVAQLVLEQAQQKRHEREATVSKIKNVLGIFSKGWYLGYIGSLSTPIGISLGWTSEGSAFFVDTGFAPPVFEGYEHSNDLSYIGNKIQNSTVGFTYLNENDNTAFLWDAIAGLNINIIKTLLWADIGVGFRYRQDYKLYTETSGNSSNKTWIKNGLDDKFKPLVSAGLYIKLWYFYIQGKYKYIVGEEIDASTYGLNHLSLGLGYIWRIH
jgi:TolB-like protein